MIQKFNLDITLAKLIKILVDLVDSDISKDDFTIDVTIAHRPTIYFHLLSILLLTCLVLKQKRKDLQHFTLLYQIDFKHFRPDLGKITCKMNL